MASCYKNKELLRQVNILCKYDSYRTEILKAKLRAIDGTDESTTINITQPEPFKFGAKILDMPTSEHKKTIQEEFYEIVRRQSVYNNLITLLNHSDNKEEYTHIDCYNLFKDLDEDDDHYYNPVLTIKAHRDILKCYECNADQNKKLSVKQYLLMIMPYLFDSMNNHKDEIDEWSIHLDMRIYFAKPIDDMWLHGHNIKSNVEEIRSDSETNKIVTMLLKSFMNNYHEKKEILRKEENLVFDCIVSFSYNIYRNKRH